MRRWSQYFLHTSCVAILDLVLINMGLLIAFYLRRSYLADRGENLNAYIYSIPWISLSGIWIFYISDLYTNWLRRAKSHIICSLFFAILALQTVTMAVTFWDRRFAFPRSILLSSFFIQFLLISIWRLWVQETHRQISGRRPVLIVGGDKSSALSITETFLRSGSNWYRVMGYLPPERIDRLEACLAVVDAVVLSPTLEDKSQIMARCAKLGKDVLIVPDLFELSLLGAQPQEIDDALLVSTQSPHLDPFQIAVKRLIDIVGAAVIAMVSSPVLLSIYLLVPLTSRGSAFFKQERVGRHHKSYVLYKFRTMVIDAESTTGPVLATRSDHRVTRLGKFLRSTRFDELPQLWNVITGDMSLVGPRPEREFFVRQFCLEVPNYDSRFMVKPGITGLAQVLGRYSTSAEKKLRFDLMYALNYSLMLDLRILIQTVRVVLLGHSGESEEAADVRSIEFSRSSSDQFTPWVPIDALLLSRDITNDDPGAQVA
jgi:exopolysaccharide biosynthesis polyprenyl glycosylphosphotransferase